MLKLNDPAVRLGNINDRPLPVYIIKPYEIIPVDHGILD